MLCFNVAAAVCSSFCDVIWWPVAQGFPDIVTTANQTYIMTSRQMSNFGKAHWSWRDIQTWKIGKLIEFGFFDLSKKWCRSYKLCNLLRVYNVHLSGYIWHPIFHECHIAIFKTLVLKEVHLQGAKTSFVSTHSVKVIETSFYSDFTWNQSWWF